MFYRIGLMLAISLIIISGCSSEGDQHQDQDQDQQPKETSTEKENEETLYDQNGLTISKVSGWSIDQTQDHPLTVTLSHEKAKAIVSVIKTDKKLEDLKNEILAGAGDVELLKDQKQFLSYRTKQKESIRTNIYFEKVNDEFLILTFMADSAEFGNLESNIEKFRNALNY